jgi:hypothetical protein
VSDPRFDNQIERLTKAGIGLGRIELVKLLLDLKVIRASMFAGEDWAVIYTEDGPKDIKISTLLGEDND